MKIFESENEMLAALEAHRELIRQCAAREISFPEFLAQYNDFYAAYALDGHESDAAERALFEKHAARIAVHREIFETLGNLCADEDAPKAEYVRAGRFGSDEAFRGLQAISRKHSIL